MSDSQVIQYVKDGQKTGKTEKQLAQELAARGVTRAQAERIKMNFEESQGRDLNVIDQSTSGQVRERKHDPTEDMTGGSFDLITQEVEKNSAASDKHVFGRNVFRSKNLTFEPNFNLATPENYLLGPGDEIVIHIWGANEAVIRQVITPEGDVMIKNLGPLYLNGMTIKEANQYARKELSKIYSGIDPSNEASEIKLTLGQIRSIQVNVMGEVRVPGTYRISSFATLLHAIYCAGGVNDIGTLRNIMLLRNNTCIAVLDLYEVILNGQLAEDVRLMEGDFIVVPPYEIMVSISGKIKRDMYYEMKKGESLATLLKFAGGFTGDAFMKSMRIVRECGTEYQLYMVDEMDYSNFILEDGDAATVGSILDRFRNRVEIRGAVYRDGMYELSGSMNTVRQLIAKAEGLKGDAFMNRAQLFREREDLTIEVIPIHLQGLLYGTEPDIPLTRNDVLVISSMHELQARGYFTITGEVARPATYPYAENTTLEDIILQAGGLLESASTVQVDVSRRIKNAEGSEPVSQLSEVFTFSVKDGLVVDGKPDFVLEPYDDIVVRRSPAYQSQRKVRVIGEVVFEGGYTLMKKNERLSDLIKRAKGLTLDAYPKGARLIRKMNDEEKAVRATALRMAARKAGNDSIVTDQFYYTDRYAVGIELDKALANPGSDYDVVLREGDELNIPEYQSTVRINGVVMYPNTVFYKKGKKLKYYINQAGGYAHRAKKGKIYVVYMNGTVSRVSRYKSNMIMPGCEIIVPSKKDRKGLELSTMMGIATSSASIATMAATIANLTK